MEQIIAYILMIIVFYVAVGIAFSVIFIWKGLTTVDPSARGTGIGFKILIFPGLIIFWPVFVNKWIKAGKA